MALGEATAEDDDPEAVDSDGTELDRVTLEVAVTVMSVEHEEDDKMLDPEDEDKAVDEISDDEADEAEAELLKKPLYST